MTHKTLLQYYHDDIAGMSSKEREPFRQDWHNAARRFLELLSLSCDPVPDLKERPEPKETGTVMVRGRADATDGRGLKALPGKPIPNSRYRRVSYRIEGGVTTIPFGGAFIHGRPESELYELYRATQPKLRKPGRKPKSEATALLNSINATITRKP